MKERPIIFSAPMVRAIIEGRKIQTRRILKPRRELASGGASLCPYGLVGDRLWVRETWMPNDPPSGVIYRADDPTNHCARFGKWKSPLFLKRSDSRITLEITQVRAQRVQDITEEDALAEGIRKEDLPPDPDAFHPPGSYGFVCNENPVGKIWPLATQAYRELWDSINGKRAPWASNPWIWAVTFRRIK